MIREFQIYKKGEVFKFDIGNGSTTIITGLMPGQPAPEFGEPVITSATATGQDYQMGQEVKELIAALEWVRSRV